MHSITQNRESQDREAHDKIKIILVDDHPLFRKGLRFIIESDPRYQVIGEATDGLEGVKLVDTLMPDVVLLDVDMPSMNGVEALSLMLNDHPQLAIIMLTVSDDSNDLAMAMKYGAKGYLLKSIDSDFLLNAIEKAVEGDNVLSPEMTNKLIAQLRGSEQQKAEESAIQSLTSRELEVLKWLTKGISNKEIARKMDVTESTVKVHVQNVLRKLNLQSRVQAALFAIENQLEFDE